VDEIDAVKHLGASRAGEGLAHAEEFLILRRVQRRCPAMRQNENLPLARRSIGAFGRIYRGTTRAIEVSLLKLLCAKRPGWELTILK
jgi:hypothetical protein